MYIFFKKIELSNVNFTKKRVTVSFTSKRIFHTHAYTACTGLLVVPRNGTVSREGTSQGRSQDLDLGGASDENLGGSQWPREWSDTKALLR
jgi:hypothetical protein